MESPVKIVAIFMQLICIIKSQKYLSHDGTPSQSTTYYWINGYLGAPLAVNGGPTNDFSSRSCATTATNQITAWWMLAFPGNTIYFTNVNIFYRSNTLNNFAGYSLYVTNSSVTTTSPKPTNGHLCFHHTGTTLPSMNQTVDCNVLGQYIVIYNERNTTASDNTPGYSNNAWLELCDVQIYGCYKGWWNSTCSTPCPVNCVGDHCYPGNGRCVWGCDPDNCLNDICDTATGRCTVGCKIGLRGDYCDKLCASGAFGTNCSGNCHCINQTCNPINGKCPDGGCQPGYKGENCSTKCSLGNYGYNCNQSCDGCLSDSCEKEHGVCTNTTGCKPGWQYGQPGQRKCDIEQVYPSESQTSNIVPIAGGIVGVVVAMVLVVILVILIRYRSANNKAKYHESGGLTPTKSEDITYVNKVRASVRTDYVEILLSPFTSHKTEQVYNKTVADDDDNNGEAVNGIVPPNDVTTQYRIPVKELHNVINEKHTNHEFLKEYRILPKGLVLPHAAGRKEENKIKNRFLDTLPYDHSRVVIQGNTSSDYINANFIDSYTAKKAYIASQGPKPNTVTDFWQMIWQERVDKIVMVTQLVEETGVKCHRYWPESTMKPLQVGKIKVQIMQEKEHTVYVYRMIKLLNDKEAKAERTVHHFHFTQWPDHGVPDKIKLVSFYRKVKRTKTALNGPLAVHCSAGLGRTGTFIAIDALYEHGQKTGYVDIMEYAQMMRKDRMNMIQTKDQYIAVYEALSEALTVSDTGIEKDKFCDHLESQQNKHIAKNQTFLRLEFQKIQDMKPAYPSEFFRAAKSKENTGKNVFQTILPHDNYRPFLMSYEKSRNDYINAVVIPECVGKRNILVTQYPLQDTVVDFWTMVYDTDSTVVVVLELLNENVPLWPNHGDVFHYEKFNISHSSDASSFQLDIKLNHKETNKNTTVRVVSMTEWNTDNVPSSGKCMLDLLNTVSSWRVDHPGSVTVVCQDGCKRSGVFAALSLVLEKIEKDDEVDIFQVVRTIQIRRPEFFPNFDQYEYCYQCTKEHLEGNSIYANA